jgi:hypothetical protein
MGEQWEGRSGDSKQNFYLFEKPGRFAASSFPHHDQKTCHPESAGWRMRDLPINITEFLWIYTCLYNFCDREKKDVT